MKLIFIATFIFLFSYCFSQTKPFDITHKYTVREVLEDIDYTEKYLIKFHPDPFKYISKDSLQAFVVRIKLKIDTPLTEMQVRFYLRQIVAKIGSQIISGDNYLCKKNSYRKEFYRSSISSGAVGLL